MMEKNYKDIKVDLLLQKTGTDLNDKSTFPSTAVDFEGDLLVPFIGKYKTADDYYRDISSFHRIPNIKVPFFIMNSFDDPIIGEACIDFDIFKTNENVILATTKYGGHLGYFEDVLGDEQWFIQPVFKFLDVYNEAE